MSEQTNSDRKRPKAPPWWFHPKWLAGGVAMGAMIGTVGVFVGKRYAVVSPNSFGHVGDWFAALASTAVVLALAYQHGLDRVNAFDTSDSRKREALRATALRTRAELSIWAPSERPSRDLLVGLIELGLERDETVVPHASDFMRAAALLEEYSPQPRAVEYSRSAAGPPKLQLPPRLLTEALEFETDWWSAEPESQLCALWPLRDIVRNRLTTLSGLIVSEHGSEANQDARRTDDMESANFSKLYCQIEDLETRLNLIRDYNILMHIDTVRTRLADDPHGFADDLRSLTRAMEAILGPNRTIARVFQLLNDINGDTKQVLPLLLSAEEIRRLILPPSLSDEMKKMRSQVVNLPSRH